MGDRTRLAALPAQRKQKPELPRARRGSGLLGAIPTAIPLTALAVALFACAVFAIGVGAVSLPASTVFAGIRHGLDGQRLIGNDFIVWQLRAPRIIEALLVGAGLAVAGALVQVLVRNPIADPFTLGLSSGAALGAVTILTTAGLALAGGLTLPAGAFFGAAAVGVVVFALATSTAGVSATRLVLVGVAVGNLTAGVTSFLILQAGDIDATQQVIYWLVGSLSGANWDLVLIAAPPVVLLVAASGLLSRRLDLLALGDTTAAALGLHPGRARILVFAIAASLTGTAVSISGTIGFVGLVVPNLARILVGGLHRRVVPCSALLGALLMLLADTGARTVLAPTELPVGILTAFIGVPVFVAVLRHRAAAR